jgi:hypothetical protein
MRFQTRRRLKIGLGAAGFALMFGAIPVNAQTIVGLGPSSSGSVTITSNGSGNPIDVVLPAVLSGTGYEFDSGGTVTVFSPSSPDLTPFSSSDQGTTLSLGGGTPTLVTWVNIGGGGLPGILVMQFITPLQSPGTYDDLILNITSASQPLIPAPEASLTNPGPNYASPNPRSNICDPSIACSYSSTAGGGGPIVISSVACGPFHLTVCDVYGPDPITTTADISSGEVFLGTPLATPEPPSFLLMGSGLLALIVITRFKALTA